MPTDIKSLTDLINTINSISPSLRSAAVNKRLADAQAQLATLQQAPATQPGTKVTVLPAQSKIVAKPTPKPPVYTASALSGLTATPKVTPISVPKPAPVTPFEKVLPYEKIFNQNLIQSLAESQINPEISRQLSQARQTLGNNLAESGAYMTGLGRQQAGQLTDAFGRQQKEDISNFTNQLNNYGTDWYNQQKTDYYQNPSRFVMPKVPTFDDYIKQNPLAGLSYNQATNVPTTFKNPYLF